MARERERPVEVLTDKTPVYHVCRVLSWLAFNTLFPSRIWGLEHLPTTGGALIASNHQSFFDIPLLSMTTRRHVSFVARDSLADAKWLAYVMRECGAVLIRRGQQDRQALRDMVAHLEAGDCLSIFPEGTRTSDGRIQSLRRGALLPAKKTRAPIVPAAIRGTFRVWPRSARLPRPARVSVQYGPPVDSSAPDAGERLQAILERMVGDGQYTGRPVDVATCR